MTRKMRIWYFTGTGQCGRLAGYVADALRAKGDVIKVENITPLEVRQLIQETVTEEQLVLIFPIYGSEVPEQLKELLMKLKGNRAAIILVALWGNSHKGKAIQQGSDILSKNGFLVNGMVEMVAKHSYLESNIPIVSDVPSQEEKERLVNYIIHKYLSDRKVEAVIKGDSLGVKIICSLPQGVISKLVTKLELKDNQCNRCGLCKKMCTCGAISSDFTINNKKCIRCLACVSCCKKEARVFKIEKFAVRALSHHQKVQHDNIFYE